MVGSLKFRHLQRLVLKDGRIVGRPEVFQNDIGRVRDVRQGPDGLLYVLVDDDDGAILRIEPAE